MRRKNQLKGLSPVAIAAVTAVNVGEVVEKSPVQKPETKREWALTQGAFRQLLDWLDSEADSGGERYLEMRRRLVLYFDRKNCPSPDDLADETLNRVARRLEEEGAITSDAPAHYCYIVARFVFLESLRKQQRQQPLDDAAPFPSSASAIGLPDASEEHKEKEKRWECLERCMRSLEPDNRELILRYYHGERRAKIENRRAMAEKLRVTVNALSIRACRIRDRLEACTRKCLGGE